jgi:hypothetical protein
MDEFSDNQALMPAQVADERRSAQVFAGFIVPFAAASLVLSVSLPLAAEGLSRLWRCFMDATLLRQTWSMPQGCRLFDACCDDAFGRCQLGAGCLLLKAISEPMDIVGLRSHAFRCVCFGVPAEVRVLAEE